MANVSMVDGHIDEPKLTDEQIIKAMGCGQSVDDCSECDFEECLAHAIPKSIFDLINRQKEQINGLIAAQETLQKHLAERNAEIERLKNAYKQCAWERDIFAEEMVGE